LVEILALEIRIFCCFYAEINEHGYFTGYASDKWQETLFVVILCFFVGQISEDG
jgi:hypothetical protein